MSRFGFASPKAQDHHRRNYHPEEKGLGPNPFIPGVIQTTAEAKWPCEVCGKKFTRQSILKGHRDAHYGERKHACETCGKKFTRANDRNRHRKIHVRKLVRGSVMPSPGEVTGSGSKSKIVQGIL